jgi:transaldolase
MDAYLSGLEKAKERGLDLARIRTLAALFVSRVDTEIDKRIDAQGTDEAKALRGKAGLANARLAYQAYEEVFGSADNSTPPSDRWAALEKAGARKQRPLWASTGVKDKAYKSTLYVDELVAPNTVNTMPEATLLATEESGEIRGDAVSGTYEQARADIDALAEIGISYDEVVELLEKEGVDKFEDAWNDLLKSTEAELERLAPSEG